MASRPAFAEIRKGMSGSIGVPHDVLIRHAHESIEEQRWRREDHKESLSRISGQTVFHCCRQHPGWCFEGLRRAPTHVVLQRMAR